MASDTKIQRIRKELIAAGMGSYGLRKAESHYLPEIIHENEHIGGVVYGRYEGGGGMLIATDRRVIFLDKKPLFNTNEEVTYIVVSGFKIYRNGLVNNVTLHTKVKDFTLKFVNIPSASRFKKYLESRSLEGTTMTNEVSSEPSSQAAFLTPEAITFMQTKDIAVLSTADKKNQVHGAVVYYVLDEQHHAYILTKADTTKTRNIIAHKQVALTIFDAEEAKTLQIQGIAQIETDEKVKRQVFDTIMKPHKYKSGYKLPPVAYVEAGMFVIIKITIETANYSDFSKKQ